MAEYIERESLVRQIICNMTEFVGAPDDVQKHDEQCNYAINMIEDAPIADVAPVVHGQWIEPTHLYYGAKQYECSLCYSDTFWKKHSITEKYPYCPNCGCRMDGGAE